LITGCGGRVVVDCEPAEVRAWDGPLTGPIGAAAVDAPAFDVWVGSTVETDGQVDGALIVLAGEAWGCERPDALDVAVWSGAWAHPREHAKRVSIAGAWPRPLEGGFEEVLAPLPPTRRQGLAHVAVRLASGVTCGAATTGHSMRWGPNGWTAAPEGAALGLTSCER
jgi:hypothetical protein